MWTDDKTKEAVRLLYESYPSPDCALNFRNRFELIVAVVLSAQTTDKQVNKVTPALFDAFPTPQKLGEAKTEDVENLIKRIGMYRTKAKNIIGLSQRLSEEFGGEVPSDFESLISLPGVGRKTANVVRAVGFRIPAIPVDTHVFRVSGRLGLAKGRDVVETEQLLTERLPKGVWIDMHHALIRHGRDVCKAKKPDCDNCNLASLCEACLDGEE